MRSAELVDIRNIQLAERPLPEGPGPGEVMVKLCAVGLCGSDLHWYQDGGIGYVPARYPMVLGHEPVGEVVGVGSGVTTHKAGDRVAIEPSVTCGHCEYCRSASPNNCTSSVFMGGVQLPGFFREYAAVPARNAEHIPNGMGWIEATLIEPVAVIVHVMELAKVRVGDTVAVLGAGPIGLLAAQMARLSGAANVFLMDRVAHRLALGRRLGAGVVVHSPREKIVEAVMDSTRGRGVDVVFDAAASPDTVEAGFAIARPGGQYVMIGLPTRKMLAIDIHTAMMKELRIQTIKRSNAKGHEAAALIEAGRIPDCLITHRLPLEKTAEAFQMMDDYRDGVGKLVIEM